MRTSPVSHDAGSRSSPTLVIPRCACRVAGVVARYVAGRDRRRRTWDGYLVGPTIRYRTDAGGLIGIRVWLRTRNRLGEYGADLCSTDPAQGRHFRGRAYQGP
jgi:hypothetical protein